MKQYYQLLKKITLKQKANVEMVNVVTVELFLFGETLKSMKNLIIEEKQILKTIIFILV